MTQKKAIMMKMMMLVRKERPTRVIALTQILTRKNQILLLKEMMTSTLKRTKNGESRIKTMEKNPLKNLEVQEKTMTLMEMRTTENTDKYDAINRLMCVNRK